MTQKEKFLLRWSVTFFVFVLVLPLVLMPYIGEVSAMIVQMIAVLIMFVILGEKAGLPEKDKQ